MDQQTFTNPGDLQVWLTEQTGSAAAAARITKIAQDEGGTVSVAPADGRDPGWLILSHNGTYTAMPQPVTAQRCGWCHRPIVFVDGRWFDTSGFADCNHGGLRAPRAHQPNG